MQRTSIQNVMYQMRRWTRFKVLIGKISRRIIRKSGTLSHDKNLKWIKSNLSEFGTIASQLDRDLWTEAQMEAERIRERGEAVLSSIPYDLGGGGAYPALYFLVRYLKPNTILETGVAAGFSSSAILSALRVNGTGHLYSSDFPYFRLPNPEQYIGVVVDHYLKGNWTLFTEGDTNNLPKILEKIISIDLLHYDSDKTYQGRAEVMRLVSPRLAPGAVVLMDDIQDNSFFHDYVLVEGRPWSVFEFEGKYVGIIGDLQSAVS